LGDLVRKQRGDVAQLRVKERSLAESNCLLVAGAFKRCQQRRDLGLHCVSASFWLKRSLALAGQRQQQQSRHEEDRGQRQGTFAPDGVDWGLLLVSLPTLRAQITRFSSRTRNPTVAMVAFSAIG